MHGVEIMPRLTTRRWWQQWFLFLHETIVLGWCPAINSHRVDYDNRHPFGHQPVRLPGLFQLTRRISVFRQAVADSIPWWSIATDMLSGSHYYNPVDKHESIFPDFKVIGCLVSHSTRIP